MLTGIRFLSADDTEKQLKKEKKISKKISKKDKKKRRKERKSAKKKQQKDEVVEAAPSGLGEHSVSEDSGDSEVSGETDRGANDGTDTATATARQRDDWMTVPIQLLRPKVTDEIEDKPLSEQDDKPKISAKEVNPDMAAQRDGLPSSATPSLTGVGDGGASWRMKALRRAQSQAAEGGGALEELVAHRWGSLQQLTQQLTTSRAAHGRAHIHAAKARSHGGDDNMKNAPSDTAHYLRDVRSERGQMRRPKADQSLSWRKDKGKPPRELGTEDGSRVQPDRTAVQPPPSSDQSTRHPNRAAASGQPQDRTDAAASHRVDCAQRQRHSREDNNRVRAGGMGVSQRYRDPLGRKEDADLIRAATAQLNKFSSDGSFMERFSTAEHDSPGRTQEQQQQTHKDMASPDVVSSSSMEEEEDTRAAGVRGGVQGDRQEGGAAGRDPPAAKQGSNQSAADALRARLKGVTAAEPSTGPPASSSVIQLPLLDAHGKPLPGAFGRDTNTAIAGHSRRLQRDDEVTDLATDVRRQRYEGEGDIDETLAQNIMRSKRFRTQHMDADEEYDHDGTQHMYQKKKPKTVSDMKAKDKQRQIRQYNKMNALLDNCLYCIASSKRPRHLTIALGETAYLALPERGRLVPGHAVIMPVEHVASSRQVDDHVWTEIRNFKKCLIRMFATQGKMVIFMETATDVNGMQSHAIIDCIPVSQSVYQKAPLYFKKGIDDAESEWSQHHAKRLIDTTQKGLRGCIPPNFPYFNVEFGLTGGYVHVIEDQKTFPRNFGRSIMVGLLKLPEEDMHRKAQQDSLAMQKQWVAEFRKEYDPYDWTKKLHDS